MPGDVELGLLGTVTPEEVLEDKASDFWEKLDAWLGLFKVRDGFLGAKFSLECGDKEEEGVLAGESVAEGAVTLESDGEWEVRLGVLGAADDVTRQEFCARSDAFDLWPSPLLEEAAALFLVRGGGRMTESFVRLVVEGTGGVPLKPDSLGVISDLLSDLKIDTMSVSEVDSKLRDGLSVERNLDDRELRWGFSVGFEVFSLAGTVISVDLLVTLLNGEEYFWALDGEDVVVVRGVVVVPARQELIFGLLFAARLEVRRDVVDVVNWDVVVIVLCREVELLQSKGLLKVLAGDVTELRRCCPALLRSSSPFSRLSDKLALFKPLLPLSLAFVLLFFTPALYFVALVCPLTLLSQALRWSLA